MNAVSSFLFGSPQKARLGGAIGHAWIEFDAQIQQHGANALTEGWARAACQLLQRAESNLATGNLQQGWVSLSAAQRELLAGSRDAARIQRAAIALRRELGKVSGWRAKAIGDLICDPKGELRDSLEKEPQCVIDALAMRDDEFNTTYFKILLRRRSLVQLFLLLLASILSCLVLSYWGQLPEPLSNTRMVVAVVLFGVLGAGVSVAQGLLPADLAAKIPAQQLGSFVVWMRPTVGAATALVAFVLLHANQSLKIFAWDTTDPILVMVIAFVAGFSERFIVGAIERIPFASEKKDAAKQ